MRRIRRHTNELDTVSYTNKVLRTNLSTRSKIRVLIKYLFLAVSMIVTYGFIALSENEVTSYVDDYWIEIEMFLYALMGLETLTFFIGNP